MSVVPKTLHPYEYMREAFTLQLTVVGTRFEGFVGWCGSDKALDFSGDVVANGILIKTLTEHSSDYDDPSYPRTKVVSELARATAESITLPWGGDVYTKG